jgi:UTP--glucose-1-phosphate uridylyltransferase
MLKKPTKAIIAAAGFGTRFLPQTKAMPKEMLPIIDKPIIQYVVEDLVAAGIKDIIIVTGYNKRSIEDHFDTPNQDLINNLQSGGKHHLLGDIEEIANLANFIYVRQKGPYGNATSMMCARHLIGDEPFIYTYADDLTLPNRFEKMVALYQDLRGAVLPCIKISRDEDYTRYGVLAGQDFCDGVIKMTNIVEKPGRHGAPSDLASIGGYLFTPEIFDYIDKVGYDPASGKEFQLQPALLAMINDGLPAYGMLLKDGKYFDTGNKLEYLKTTVEFALNQPDIEKEFRAFLRGVL